MSQREPFEYVEIDIDYCDRAYGQGACTAALGVTGERKCYNMFAHCQDQENFLRGTLTLQLCKPLVGSPVGMFPVLESVSATTSTVNIGGADDKLSSLGRRGTIDLRCRDFAYHDRFFDKYQAERISGAAQTDEPGYNPADRGSFWPKLRARWPYYAGRPVRHVQGYLDGGTLTITKTRHFVITEMTIGDDGSASIKGKDILDLADNKKAVAPKTTQGRLAAVIDKEAMELTLIPAGIGDSEYAAAGTAAIGSELVRFTRAGDVITITERGAGGTEIANHDAEDTLQQSYSIYKKRVDEVIRELLVDYAGINPAFIPFTKWQAEVSRWAGNFRLTTDIPKPEGVAKLVGELSVLGVSIWWDDVAQEIGLKMIRPIDGDMLYVLDDNSAIKEIAVEDRDDDRLTEVSFYSVIVRATDSVTKPENYAQQRFLVDLLSKTPNAYGDTKKSEIFMRWLNHGDTRTVRIAGRRVLQRMKTPPKRYRIVLDAKDDGIGLTDVLQVTSRVVSDPTGKPETRLVQVVSKRPLRAGHEFEVIAQSYIYDGRFGYITPNDYPTYDVASAAQIESGAFMVDATLKFPDGTKPYELI
jgi:hypothetical protein